MIAAFILLMVFMAGVASLVKIWPYAFTNPERYPQIWTLKHYAFNDVGGGGYAAFWNSLKMAGLTAVFGAFVTFTSAYLIDKTKGAVLLRRSAYFLSIIPLALPGLVIGIAYIFFFNKTHLGIPFTVIKFYQSFQRALWNHGDSGCLQYYPFLYGQFPDGDHGYSAAGQRIRIGNRIDAVPFYRTFMRVTVPVCFPAILEIAVFYFVSSMATVSAVIFLYTSNNPLASVAVINMDDAGDTAPAAAMCMLIVLANVIVRCLAELASRRFKVRTQGWRSR